MTASKSTKTAGKNGRAPRSAPSGPVTCKTCTLCRQKKIKCDGARPKCNDCLLNGLDCVYPRDARRELRPSRTRIQNLEHTISAMLEHMRASGVDFPHQPMFGEGESRLPPDQGSPAVQSPDAPTAPVSETSLPALSNNYDATQANLFGRIELTPISNPPDTANRRNNHEDRNVGRHEPTVSDEAPRSSPRRKISTGAIDGDLAEIESAVGEDVPGKSNSGSTSNSLSPCEARVAGVFHENGCVSSVHGLAGIMNPTCRERHNENISKLTRKGETAIAESKARLISNAALQKQREARLFRQPRDNMDLDGCDPEMAKHLLDLHFNRQHYAYLVSYRPAIMDSLANGGGPWANKLLLNAIFYSGALYSDRECLRSVPGDSQSAGSHFYRRFKQLLVDEIDKPSIASAMALLLTSASLVSQGHSSAGWSLSGTAYRMILDLGCHMMLAPDYQSGAVSSGRKLRLDVELEMRKRLYWGAYATDATQALYLGRPCMFASVEARVPLQPLDTFEELEDWQPYKDPYTHTPNQPAYSPQPAHAVSTFMALARLLQISTRITDLYGIQSIKLGSEVLLDRKRSIEWDLENWRATLPAHLRFDPEGPSTPPPHQITPLTTFHALTILLHRAYLDQGHLRHYSDDASKRRGEDACIESALMIEKYVRAYRNAFSLRRAPFLLSYAVYSAVTAILHRERQGRGQFTEPISFFWTCLNELQRGCNFGLKKPLAILQDMVHELQFSANESTAADIERQLIQPSLDESLFFRPPSIQEAPRMSQTSGSSGPTIVTPEYWNTLDHLFDPTNEPVTRDMMDFLNGQENDIYQDSLYGLFAPSPQHLP
ncbi:hypothetical protein jhhlp_000177 [Lomentospora prolificans]|uniref:Zn(2)-C6 fungal-type domain-containing protein n=1 Tax=Lomentospora prolificans TaxID=41688 RepID=A0A2N3NLU0_9PEZI|nr:hypothetical protein jhhlp_000177 [Lomentospora prolificans]